MDSARCHNCGHCLVRGDHGICTETQQRVRLNAVCQRHPWLTKQQKLFRAEHLVGTLEVAFE